MSEEGNNLPPDEVPLALGKEEVERLLQEAESLVSEIAGTVGLHEEFSANSEGKPQPTPEEPDALSAVEMAEVQVEQIEQAVGVDDPPVFDHHATAAGNTIATNEELPVSATVQLDARRILPDEGTLPVAPRTDSPLKEKPPAQFASDVATLTAPEAKAPLTTEPATVGTMESAHATQEVVAATTDARATPKDRPRLLRVIFLPILIVRNIVVAIVNNFVRLLLLLDRPFAGLSPTARMVLGMIGLISLLLGVAAFVLPGLGTHNPYEKMELFP